MPDSLVKLIDEALAAMPRDLLAQVPAEHEVRHGPAARIPRKLTGDSEEKLMEWVRERLRPVGVALGQDQRAGKRFTGRLPKARVPLVHCADLSKVPELVRMEFERIEKEYRHVEPAWPEEVQRAYREGLQDILRHGPLPHVRPRAEWPAEITRVWAEAQELTEKARAEWEAALLKQPMAWLGAVLYGLPEVTGQRAIQGLPEWPGLKKLSARERTLFMESLPLIMGREISSRPGEAANQLFRALEELKRLVVHPKDVRAELTKQSGRGGAGATKGAPRPPAAKRRRRPVLSGNAAAVLRLLQELPEHLALTGPRILDKLSAQTPPVLLDQSTLTRRVMPILKKYYGVKNNPRIGYYVADRT
jgi:hypothetical protein